MSSRILIWSQRPAFVRGMQSLAHREGLQVLGIARTASEAIVSMRSQRPDAVLVDRETYERHPETVVELMAEGEFAKVVSMDLADDAVLVLEGRRARAATVRDLVRTIEGGLAHQVA